MARKIILYIGALSILLVVLQVSIYRVQAQEKCAYTDRGYCVPKPVDVSSDTGKTPAHIYGNMTFYDPDLMERVARNRGYSLTAYKGGISLISCADIGKTAWIKRQNKIWDGPYLVVDCSQKKHMWVNVSQFGSVGEVSFPTALAWRMVVNVPFDQYAVRKWKEPVEVFILGRRLNFPQNNETPVVYKDWWLNQYN